MNEQYNYRGINLKLCIIISTGALFDGELLSNNHKFMWTGMVSLLSECGGFVQVTESNRLVSSS